MKIHVFGYTGDGSDNRSIPLNVSPQFVILRGAAQVGVFRTNTMVGDLTKEMTGTTVPIANCIQSLGTFSMVIGSDARVNSNGVLYGGAAIEDNGAGDFGITQYTGDGNDNRILTLTGVTNPAVVLVVCDQSVRCAWRTNFAASTDESYTFTTGGMLTNVVQAIGTTTVTLGTAAEVNANGNTYHLIGIKTTPTLFFVTGYTGSGADNRSITGADFTPSWAWVQSRANLARSCHQRHGNVHVGDQNSTFGSGDGTNSNQIQAFEATGIQIGSQAGVNANTELYQTVMMISGEVGGGLALNRTRRGWGL